MMFESTPAITGRLKWLVEKLGYPDGPELDWNLDYRDDCVILPDDAPQYYVDLLAGLMKQASGKAVCDGQDETQ